MVLIKMKMKFLNFIMLDSGNIARQIIDEIDKGETDQIDIVGVQQSVEFITNIAEGLYGALVIYLSLIMPVIMIIEIIMIATGNIANIEPNSRRGLGVMFKSAVKAYKKSLENQSVAMIEYFKIKWVELAIGIAALVLILVGNNLIIRVTYNIIAGALKALGII